MIVESMSARLRCLYCGVQPMMSCGTCMVVGAGGKTAGQSSQCGVNEAQLPSSTKREAEASAHVTMAIVRLGGGKKSGRSSTKKRV